MKKNPLFIIGVFIIALGISVGGYFIWRILQGALPALRPPADNITDLVPPSGEGTKNDTDISEEIEHTIGNPLTLPDGFSISIFAKDLPGVRVMAFDLFDNVWVSQTKEGVITLLEVTNGRVVQQNPILRGLNRPHGLVFDPEFPSLLYFAEEDKISKVATYSDGKVEQILDLPEGERHFTRTLGFGSDQKLYVSVGSSCDVCQEEDGRYAAIYSLRKDGSGFSAFAQGLRNAVFFTFNPVDGKMWTTEMGRDWLGDNLPPDEINIVEKGKHYGWPFCYGKNVQDVRFDASSDAREFCKNATPSFIDIPAHSAPLGLAFIPQSDSWPEDYWYDLLVAYHGSWNRSVPTGYKVVRYKFDADGKYGGVEDFTTGWLRNGEVLGRPVDIVVRKDGTLYISDDKAGVIYQVTHKK